MADLPQGTQVRRDETGVARSIRMPRTDAASADAFARDAKVPATARELADTFVLQAGPLLRLEQSNLSGLSGLQSDAAPTDKMQLSFKEEKGTSGSATVVYDQTVLGLPVWNSGLTVQIATDGLRVLGSQNQLDYDIEIDRLPATGLLPEVMKKDRLAPLLGLSSAPPELVINGTRQLIYRYQAAERLDPALHISEPAPMQGPPPTLPLPPISPSIIEGRHYVVTEVLFTLPLPSQGRLNWRAFVEPTTGTVLYLRALVACLHGAVFLTDATLADGRLVSVDSTKDELNGVRSMVELAGLNGGTGVRSELKGEYVELRETSQPIVPAPFVTPPTEFVFDVQSSDFAAVCAYHHCDSLFRMVEGMGIDVRSYFDGTTFPVPVDHYGFDLQVNARAPGNITGNGSGGFEFGLAKTGQPIGIAVNARVALHEFGHALLWDHVSSPNFGFAHSAGDSLACILHDPISRLPDRFDTFPFMTASGMSLGRRHDRRVEQGWAWGGLNDNTQYLSEQVLSTTLFRIYRALGGDSTDTATRMAAARYVAFLIIKGVGLLSFTTRDPEVYVDALMDSDASTAVFEGRRGGTLHKVIRWSFEQQGLYQRPGAPRPVASKGRPPQVDVYVDNDRLGEYMPYLADAGQSRGIWNRRLADNGVENQPIVPNADNHLYVRVRNRGFGTAANVSVRAFQQTGANDEWPASWRAAGDPVSIASIAAGAEAIAGPIRWRPTQPEANILVVAAADDDASVLETVTGPASIATLVPLDNNLGHRTLGTAIS
jgi:zinc metalloprotease ZmpB